MLAFANDISRVMIVSSSAVPVEQENRGTLTRTFPVSTEGEKRAGDDNKFALLFHATGTCIVEVDGEFVPCDLVVVVAGAGSEPVEVKMTTF